MNTTSWRRTGIVLAVAVAIMATIMATQQPAAVCHEDENCWNCETMGNGICGE